MLKNLSNAQTRQHREPYDHHRTKKHTYQPGATLLKHKQTGQYDDCDRDHIVFQRGGNDLEPFYGRQYRDCWSNHTVAIEQRSRKNT